jgi:hypothetical protein
MPNAHIATIFSSERITREREFLTLWQCARDNFGNAGIAHADAKFWWYRKAKPKAGLSLDAAVEA